jgi:acyl-CoA reductase-like NAD-dependent aldehyde dehydrogenase
MAVMNGTLLPVMQPYDGELIAEIPVDTAAEIDSKLEAATRVFSSRGNWLPAYERIAILRRLARLVEDERDNFAISIAREGGKPIADAKVEVTRAINGIEYAASYV